MTWTPAPQLIQQNLDFAANPADSVTYFTTRITSPQSVALLDWAESKVSDGDHVPLNLITFLFDVASNNQPAQEIFVDFCSVGTARLEWPAGYGFEGFISEPMTILEESGDESDAPAVYAEAIRKINDAAVRWFDQDFLGMFVDEFKSVAISFLVDDDEEQEQEPEEIEDPQQNVLTGEVEHPARQNAVLVDDDPVDRLEALINEVAEVQEDPQNAVLEEEGQQPQNAVLVDDDPVDRLEALINEVAEVKEDPQELQEEGQQPQNAILEDDVQHPDPQNAILEDPPQIVVTEEDQQPQNAVLEDDVEHPDPQNAVLVDQEKIDALKHLAEVGQEFVNNNVNSVVLKNLPADRNGDNPAQIIVFEGYVLIGDNHPSVYYGAATRLGSTGQIWISAKGGVFDPGTVKVRGIPLIQQGFVEGAIKGFSKKKVEFV